MDNFDFINLLIYVIILFFFLNLFIAFIGLYKDIIEGKKRNIVLKTFFSNLIFGSIKIIDFYNFLF